MEVHSFAVCAYKESPYLEECIQSLLSQTVQSKIYISTSTPNEYIDGIASKYGIDIYVNKKNKGITEDWNYAYSMCNTRYVTIAHQDDIYLKNYTEEMLRCVQNKEKLLVYFTSAGEIRNGIEVDSNIILTIKKLMLHGIRNGRNSDKIYVRRHALAFGNPICCPSVTYDMKNIPVPPFVNEFRSNEDWQAWETISKMEGDFFYNPTITMRHRIHEESETSHIINDGVRTLEDYEMFCKFWPNWLARLLAKIYSFSEMSNKVR